MKMKIVSLITAIILVFACVGCSSNDTNANDSENSKQTATNDELKEIPLEKVVSIQTGYGEVKVSVDGAEWSGWTEYADYEEGTDSILINCSIENVSYKGEYEGEMDVSSFISAKDKDGYFIETESTAWDGGVYTPIAGGFLESKQGEKHRVALPYLIKKEPTKMSVTIGDEYVVNLTVE